MPLRLFIDDIRNAPDDSWVVARTNTEAIRILATQEVDEVSIDHDISHQVVVGGTSRPYPCNETFMPVVYYIANAYVAECGYPKVIIHTSNPVGAKEMKKVLDDWIIPNKYTPYKAANRLEIESN